MFTFRCLLLRIFGAKVPLSFRPYPSSKVWAPVNLSADNLSGIGPGVEIYNPDQVHLSSGVNVSQHAYICSASRKKINNDWHLVTAPIFVGENVWIAAKAYVGPGVTIGKDAIIGSCAVVTKDVPEKAIMVGNPAINSSEHKC